MSNNRNVRCARSARDELAQHFTPRAVAELTWSVARHLASHIGTELRVIDPAAGTGVFLQVVRDTDDTIHGLVRGIEIDRSLASALVSSSLADCMDWGDALLDEFPGVRDASFDVVIGNPPFGRLRHLHVHGSDPSRWQRFDIWRRKGRHFTSSPATATGACPIELLFVERALQLVRPGGIVALIMPQGFLANVRLQWARTWILERALLRAVASLPDGVFRCGHLNAQVGIVFLQRLGGSAPQQRLVRLVQANADRVADSSWLTEFARILTSTAGTGRGCTVLDIETGGMTRCRWDPAFWSGRARQERSDVDTIPLGDHIVHLTYGPIVRGQRPQHRDDGVRVIRQGDFALTGILPTPALKVTSHGAFDPDRSRVLPGDLLMPRSGSGALGENRLAVRVVEEPANVGCFVDVVRLAGVNPFYVWLYLKTREGWGQIRSLINGVGTPNINFGEIRSLRIPQIAAAQQQIVEQRYRTEVLPLHQRRARCPAEAQMADCRFRQLIAALERCLAGDHAALRACG